MKKLIWLASYPKSGNTWVRSLLANYLFSDGEPVSINALSKWAVGEMSVDHYKDLLPKPANEMPAEAICQIRPEVHRRLSDLSEGAIIVKTHNRFGVVCGTPTITPEATRAAIYIVRSPLDVVVSFADFYGLSLDVAISRTASPDLVLPADDYQVHQFLGSWSSNVASWMRATGIPVLMVRYEALLADTPDVFRNVLEFLNIDIDEDKMASAIEFSSFKSLKSQEQQEGFVEASPVTDSGFFRSGTSGGWREALNDEQAGKVIRHHQAMMRKLRYLDDNGHPTV